MWIDEVAKPTGEINGVCWTLLGAVSVGFGGALKWMSSKLEKAEAETKEERKLRDQDRKDFESQTNTLLSNIYRKKGGNTNDS